MCDISGTAGHTSTGALADAQRLFKQGRKKDGPGRLGRKREGGMGGEVVLPPDPSFSVSFP